MKKHTSSRSGLLLMEIIIAILFFSVVSAICLQLFVKAHSMGQDTRELDMAVRQCSSVAEILSQSGQPMEQLGRIYSGSDLTEEGGSVYFDEDFQTCGKEDSSYHLDISPVSEDVGLTADGDGLTSENAGLTTYDIAIYADDNNTAIYSLQIDAYRQYIP